MKRVISLVLTLVLATALLAGCATSRTSSLTFTINNGDAVKIEFDMTGSSYKLQNDSENSGFRIINADKDTVAIGEFLLGVDFATAEETLEQYDDVEILLVGENPDTDDGSQIVRYTDDSGAYQIIEIPGTDTCLQLHAETVTNLTGVAQRITATSAK